MLMPLLPRQASPACSSGSSLLPVATAARIAAS